MDILKTLFPGLFTKRIFTGVLPDPRSAFEKAKDYLHEERVFPGTPNPFGNEQILVSPYPYINQLATSSCVPHAVTLALSIERKALNGSFALLSPMFPYRLRFNYANPGSAPTDMFYQCSKWGAPLASTLPTPQFEMQANALVLTNDMYTEANIFKGLKYFSLGTKNNIDTIAGIADTGRPVCITLFATEDEYSRQYPVIIEPKLTYAQATIQHEVCVLPNSGFVKDGVKYIAVQDSAWFGGWKLRYLSEQFVNLRVYGGGYWTEVKLLSVGPKIKYNFTQNLSVGARSQEVKMMQVFLVSEGLLPTDCTTGYFGGITLAAVKAFQDKYVQDILIPNGITVPTGYWGPSSRAKANQLCA